MYLISRKLPVFFLLIFMIHSNTVECQEVDFIKGEIINPKDKTPIPFATIIIKNKAKGLISNIDGGFKIPYKFKKLGDTLVISSIGYSSKEVPLLSFNDNLINTIFLPEKIEELDEVTVVASKKKKKMSAEQIVKSAIDNISKNYLFAPFSYIGYYRDYQMKEGKYLNLNESLMEVFDSGFGAYDLKETQTRIYQHKNNSNFPIDAIASKPYDYHNKSKIIPKADIDSHGGNEYTILRLHDAIRNYNKTSYDFVGRLDLNFITNHEFKRLPNSFINNISLYSIDIYKIEENIKVIGKIFISKGDFKIYKMQYAVYDNGESIEYKKKLKRNSSSSKEKLLYEIIVEYQLYEELMYPNYISFKNSFENLQSPKFFTIDAKINYTKQSKLTFNSFELTFNNTPDFKNATKKNNYKLWFKNIKLKIDSVEIKKNVALLYLNEKMVFDPTKILLKGESISENVKIKIKNIKDVYGNLINEQEYASYNQYREFFVQELKIGSKKPSDNLYMLKNKPIFKNQPTAPLHNFSDYWLNTPLKK